MSDEMKLLADQTFREVTGLEPPTDELTPFTRRTRDIVFGEIWNEPGLTRRERRLISVVCAAFVGGVGLETHVKVALSSGDVDSKSMEAFIMHLAVYAGWPMAALVQTVLRKVLADNR